jgi:hypothetical protein
MLPDASKRGVGEHATGKSVSFRRRSSESTVIPRHFHEGGRAPSSGLYLSGAEMLGVAHLAEEPKRRFAHAG